MEIITEKKLFPSEDKYFICLMETEYQTKDGKVRKWQWARRKNDTKAVFIAATLKSEEERLVLIREYRIPAKKDIIALPAGLIEDGEDVIGTAKREIFEETGLEVVETGLSSPFLYNSPGFSNEMGAIIFMKVSGELSNKNIEGSEEIEPFIVNRGEAFDLLLKAEKQQIEMDVRTWFVLMMFAGMNKQ